MRAYVEADRAFVDAVTGGARLGPAWTYALGAIALVDAACRSAADGGVPVPCPWRAAARACPFAGPPESDKSAGSSAVILRSDGATRKGH